MDVESLGQLPATLKSRQAPRAAATNAHNGCFLGIFVQKVFETNLELVSKELNHFGVIADLFRQIGGHSSRFVLFCSF